MQVSTFADMEGEETFDSSFLGYADEVVEERIADCDVIMIKGTKNTGAVCVSVFATVHFTSLASILEIRTYYDECVGTCFILFKFVLFLECSNYVNQEKLTLSLKQHVRSIVSHITQIRS